jgi:hypothetical protein
MTTHSSSQRGPFLLCLAIPLTTMPCTHGCSTHDESKSNWAPPMMASRSGGTPGRRCGSASESIQRNGCGSSLWVYGAPLAYQHGQGQSRVESGREVLAHAFLGRVEEQQDASGLVLPDTRWSGETTALPGKADELFFERKRHLWHCRNMKCML